MNYINRFEKTDGGYLVLTDGSQVPVAKRKKDGLLHLFEKNVNELLSAHPVCSFFLIVCFFPVGATSTFYTFIVRLYNQSGNGIKIQC